jgi:HIP---CoA ligase
MRSELTFETIVTGYGLTEATGIATMCRHDDDPETIANDLGAGPYPMSRCESSTTTGVEVAVRGEPGEVVVVRGYNVMKGYFGDPGDRRRSTPTAGCTPATSA